MKLWNFIDNLDSFGTLWDRETHRK